MIVIMLSGKAESGKDTFYSIVKSEFPQFNINRFSFGDGVKEIAGTIGWDGCKDARGISYLQALCECAMAYDQDIWTKRCFSKVRDFADSTETTKNDFAIITDCRYQHQLEYFISQFEKVCAVRINRSEHTSSLSKKQTLHKSEIDLDTYTKWHFTIGNDEGLDIYTSKVIDTMSRIIESFSD